MKLPTNVLALVGSWFVAFTLGQIDLGNTALLPSDCPCDREHYKFCTIFKRENIAENVTYNVRRPAKSLRIDSPWVSTDSPLVCEVFQETPAPEALVNTAEFYNNTLCVEPVKHQSNASLIFTFNSISCFRKSTGMATPSEEPDEVLKDIANTEFPDKPSY